MIMNILIKLKLFLVVFCALILLSGCKKNDSNLSDNSQQNPSTSVAAAANLRDVLGELKTVYLKEYPNKRVEITFGSSGSLAQQIMNGAPFDLFLSADTNFPEKLRKGSKTVGNSEMYAYGKVVLWSSKQDVTEGLNLLLNPKIRKIAIANPQLAPYGKNMVDALIKSGIYHKIEHKIVWAENINQAAQFASSGNADVGFIALSNAQNKNMKISGSFYILSDKECSPVAQSGILLKGQNTSAAKDFFDFIREKEVQRIWERYGYETQTLK